MEVLVLLVGYALIAKVFISRLEKSADNLEN